MAAPRLPRPRVPRVGLAAPLARRLGIALRRNLTLANLAERLAQVYGDRIAFVLPEPSVVTKRATLSFEDVDRAVARLADAMRAAGVGLGEHVALVTANGCDYLLALLAVVRAGGVAVPINPVLKPAEVRTLVELSGARSVVVDGTTLEAVGGRRALPGVERRLVLPELARQRARVERPVPVAADTVVAILYTSGTTGRPKGARLTNEALLALLSAAALHPTGLPGSVRSAVTALPVAHIMGLATALGLMLAGIANHMLPRFDAGAVLDRIERERAELFVGVPAMYRAMLDAGAQRRDLKSVKAWASAADVMPRGLARTFQSFGRLVGPVPALFFEAYGMVELGGAALARVVPPGPAFIGRRAAGVPIPPYKVKVVDERGRQVPRGRVGELAVKGPGVLESYEGDPEATARVLRNGWLLTGDLARIGPLGTVVLEGRSKEVIKVGGYSVYPMEVEEEVRRHPKVADCAVVGVPDAVKGQVPAAAVVPAKGKRVTRQELEAWSKEAIASYRRPRRWLIVDELPRTATRKADKKRVLEMFA